jgi:hypothetical protein
MPLDPWSYAKDSEHSHQTSLFMWANMAYRFGLTAANNIHSYTSFGIAQQLCEVHNDKVQQLKWLHAVHNQGHGDAIHGAKAKAEGVKAGVFDVFLPVPMLIRQDLSAKLVSYCGLYLELKVGNNKLTCWQKDFAKDMRKAGYKCDVAYDWLEARDKILLYLGL